MKSLDFSKQFKSKNNKIMISPRNNDNFTKLNQDIDYLQDRLRNSQLSNY